MGIGKDIFGVGCSGTIVGTLFLGAPIIGVLYGFLPGDMVDMLATPERPAVYWEGAYVLADIEKDGELDGNTSDIVESDPDEEPDPDLPPGDESQDGEPSDEPSSEAGGDVATDAILTNGAGTRAGGSGSGNGVFKPPTGRQTSGVTQKESRRECVKSYEGITQRSDGTYEVSRDLVNYYSASVKHFNELGWSKPNDRGDGDGWYISGFGCNDPLYHGGLRRGDVVLTVNGKKTNSMLQVFMLYSKVKTKSHFEVKVRRRGKHIVLRYDVVKG
ncbi:MAG: hypothetical protein H6737_10355 [Alphaproteobacteria bacterium]|nr:hypothetical protein [Alphaproteobacteria bacterium]